jgi:hypothetical protein
MSVCILGVCSLRMRLRGGRRSQEILLKAGLSHALGSLEENEPDEDEELREEAEEEEEGEEEEEEGSREQEGTRGETAADVDDLAAAMARQAHI